jgi:hypothetical protein
MFLMSRCGTVDGGHCDEFSPHLEGSTQRVQIAGKQHHGLTIAQQTSQKITSFPTND